MKPLKEDDYYETPPDLFSAIDRSFGPFELDVCADFETKKCARYYSLDEGRDGLALEWAGRNFCNPPYSRGHKDAFIERAYLGSLDGQRTTMLIPATVGTKAYKEFIWNNHMAFQYPLGRVKFWWQGKPSANSGRADIMVVVFFPKISKE